MFMGAEYFNHMLNEQGSSPMCPEQYPYNHPRPPPTISHSPLILLFFLDDRYVLYFLQGGRKTSEMSFPFGGNSSFLLIQKRRS